MAALALGSMLAMSACSGDPEPTPAPTTTPDVVTSSPTPTAVARETDIRTNQFGFLPNGTKRAVVESAATTGIPWQLVDAAGNELSSGTTTPVGKDASTGLNIHTIDFTSYTEIGEGLQVVTEKSQSHPFKINYGIYQDLRRDSMSWFYLQRSNTKIDNFLFPGYGRPAGHPGDARTPCVPEDDLSQKVLQAAGDSPWTCTYDSVQLAGGWYDSGDFGKYTVNGAVATSHLLRAVDRGVKGRSTKADDAGSLNIPERANPLPDYLDEARVEIDYLLSTRVPPTVPGERMSFHKMGGLDWGKIPQDPSTDPVDRAVHRPSTEATYAAAAVFAQASRVFADHDPAYSKQLQNAAVESWNAAVANPDVRAPKQDLKIDPDPGTFDYAGADLDGYRYWALAEMAMSFPQNEEYRTQLTEDPLHTKDTFGDVAGSWMDPTNFGKLDLATYQATNSYRSLDTEPIREQIATAAERYLEEQDESPWGLPLSDFGSGSVQDVLTNLQVIAAAGDLSNDPRYRTAVADGMTWVLGGNGVNKSFVSGYGTDYAKNQVSVMYAPSVSPTSPAIPKGTVASGPNSAAKTAKDPAIEKLADDCVGQMCYVDDIESNGTNRTDATTQASLAWVTAYLDE